MKYLITVILVTLLIGCGGPPDNRSTCVDLSQRIIHEEKLVPHVSDEIEIIRDDEDLYYARYYFSYNRNRHLSHLGMSLSNIHKHHNMRENMYLSLENHGFKKSVGEGIHHYYFDTESGLDQWRMTNGEYMCDFVLTIGPRGSGYIGVGFHK